MGFGKKKKTIPDHPDIKNKVQMKYKWMCKYMEVEHSQTMKETNPKNARTGKRQTNRQIIMKHGKSSIVTKQSAVESSLLFHTDKSVMMAIQNDTEMQTNLSNDWKKIQISSAFTELKENQNGGKQPTMAQRQQSQ